MCNQNEWIVREAFLAYDRGDVARMMDFVDPEVDWTYRDPELEDSEPQTLPRPRGAGEGAAPPGRPRAAGPARGGHRGR